ncbi:nuclease-related domain-containing protein [Sulfuricurvum sp.]|uniref:nuclease-related domain-containing protein n=1 Tax=Sulfuricurvum sp. TaxID=2025608 RepID=UPI0026328746|nr:nuclease-related domain-containing protein [Sulfuricurvum sp.]MDD3595899.1 nuclease-related domain-containing protein [Sulfuricurvum sp.]
MKKIVLSDHTTSQLTVAQNERQRHYHVKLFAYNEAIIQHDTRKAQARSELINAWNQRKLGKILRAIFISVMRAYVTPKPPRPIMQGAGDQEKIWNAGNEGEKKVETFLAKSLDDQWTLINGYKNGKGEIDQILVGPRGIFAIEIKYTNGTIYCDGDRWWRDKYDQYNNLVETNKLIADKRGRSPSRQVNDSSDMLQTFLQKRYPSVRVYRSIIWAHERSVLGGINNLNVDYTAIVHDWNLDRFLGSSTYQLSQEEQHKIIESIQRDHTYYNQPRKSKN